MTTTRTKALWAHGPFSVLPQGVRVDGEPTLRSWGAALKALVRAKSGTQWATGDLLIYADVRGWAAEAIETVMDETGQQRGTLANLKAIARRFPQERRHPDLPWSHHALVASLPEAEADALLVRAAAEKWGWEELRAHAREARADAARAEQSWPEGTFGLLLAEVPWEREPNRRFAPMTTSAIAALGERVQAIAAPDSVLYLWAPSHKVASGEVSTVLEAWGFVGRSMQVWVRETMGTGVWTRRRHELLIIATKGAPVPPAEDRVPDSVLAGEPGEHASRPAEAYAMLEHCYPGVPRVELFATYAREGWIGWAGELGVTEELEDVRGITIRGELAGAPA